MNMKQKGFIMTLHLRIMIAFVLVAHGAQTLPMALPFQGLLGNGTVEDLMRRMNNQMDALGNSFQRRMERQQMERQMERRRLEGILNDPRSLQGARDQAQRELERLAQQDDRSQALINNVAEKGLNVAEEMLKTPGKMLEQYAKDQGELQRAAVNAEASKKASIKNHKETMDWIRQPKSWATVAGGVGLIVFAGYGAYHATTILAEMVRQMYSTPTLAQETSMLSLSEKISQFIFGRKVESTKVSDVILTPELEKQMAIISEALKKSVETDDFLPNILLWGPPGTGKTMVAARLARSSGMHYHIFPASSLDKYSVEQALLKLQELFEDAKKKGVKLVIVIDEAEKLFANRENNVSDKTGKMLTQLLAYTGTETTDFSVIAMTNRPQDLDEAFLSRCDYQLHIAAPDQTQRERILKKYMTDYLLTTPPATRVPTAFGRLANMIVKPKPQPRIGVAADAVNDAMIQEIARKIDGYVGRDISKMVFEMRRIARISPGKTLSKAMVEEVVDRKIKEHNQKQGGFTKDDFRVKSLTAAKPVASVVTPVVIAKPAPVKQVQPARGSKKKTRSSSGNRT